ncbi:MAG: polysaccharide biosynthesis protein [Planctomycetaceae bacterium]|nr:polysaccharide biosynthesis protein [Planctomycetaceae bacterium]
MRLIHECLNTRITRIGLMMLLDAAIIAISYAIAFWLRIDLIERAPHFVYDNSYVLSTLPWLVAIRLLCGWVCKTYHWSFRHASLDENIDLVVSVGLGSIIFALVGHFTPLFEAPPPRSIYVMEAAMTYAGMAILRFLPRYLLAVWTQRLQNNSLDGKDVKRTLIYGVDGPAELAAREILRSHGHNFALVGFLDNNPATWESSIHGVKVLGGLHTLPDVLKRESIDQILLPESGLSGHDMRRLVDICTPFQVHLKKIPDYGKILNARGIQHLENLTPESLLDRRPVRFDAVDMDAFLREKTILVTGAAGTIGAELCRQILRQPVKELVIFDFNENGLFFLDAELREAHPDKIVTLVMGSIRDSARVNQVMRDFRPSVVFHAAAHKHVPMLENAPVEAVKNNVLGTAIIAEAALANKVEKMVLISTDKAVMSASVLGASKRLAELLVRSLNGKGATTFLSVRFGNVLDSSGSLVEIVRRQIAKGGPVTVTHRDMVRFFMTIQEAAGLVLVAAALAEGDISVLDMGEAINIDSLVRQIIYLHGLTPDRDIEIRYAGPRPGEKFFESLYNEDETVRPSSFPKINLIDDGETIDAEAMLSDARRVVLDGTGSDAREFFHRWVKDYRATAVLSRTPVAKD